MHVVLVANAPNSDIEPYRALIAGADLVLAADGGAITLLQAGMLPGLVLGDLDSVDAESEAELVRRGSHIERHPREKDETDLELALLRAVEQGATRIDILGALGGRWDQTLANMWLLAHPALESLAVRLLDQQQTITLVRERASIEGRSGDTISLVPLSEQVHGVTTRGLFYPLHDATLYANQARGISNVLLEPPGEVSLTEGLLLLIQHDDGGALQWNTRRNS